MIEEIESTYKVDISRMPDIDRYPYEDITQYYLTPKQSLYEECNQAEWRVRRLASINQPDRWTAAVKFGSKADGSRAEIETELSEGDFGTRPEDIEGYAYGQLEKRRFYLEEGIIIDWITKGAYKGKLQAEKEFTSREEMAAWEPPNWLTLDSRLPSSRKLAQDLRPGKSNDVVSSDKELSEVIDQLKRYGGIIVSVSGMSGSGKSTFALHLADVLNAAYLEADHFHIGTKELLKRYGVANHDLPEAYDYSGVRSAALGLMMGRPQTVPRYDFFIGEPKGKKVISPAANGNVVVEGLYAASAFRYDRKMHISILKNSPLYVSVIRRILRDTSMRQESRAVSFSAEETLAYIHRYAVPSYLKAFDGRRFNYVIG